MAKPKSIAAKELNKELKSTSKQVKELSESDAAAALKETLNKGVEKGVDILSLEDGFYNNLNVINWCAKNGIIIKEKQSNYDNNFVELDKKINNKKNLF